MGRSAIGLEMAIMLNVLGRKSRECKVLEVVSECALKENEGRDGLGGWAEWGARAEIEHPVIFTVP